MAEGADANEIPGGIVHVPSASVQALRDILGVCAEYGKHGKHWKGCEDEHPLCLIRKMALRGLG